MEEPNKQEIFEIIKADGYSTIRLIGELVPETCKSFETEIQTIICEPFGHAVVNCELLSGISKAWLRALLKLTVDLKKVNKDIRFFHVSEDMKAFFKMEGVDKVFKTASSLREALADLKLVTKKQLDTAFINPFLAATIQVLRIQAMVKASAGKIYLKQEKDKVSGDISGVIGLVSESFNGSVVISFPESTFLKVISRMLGEDFTSITKDIADGAGELTNMIFGQAKVVLNEMGYGIKTALPSVVTGKDHSVATLTSGPVVVVPFETEVGPFFIEICLSA